MGMSWHVLSRVPVRDELLLPRESLQAEHVVVVGDGVVDRAVLGQTEVAPDLVGNVIATTLLRRRPASARARSDVSWTIEHPSAGAAWSTIRKTGTPHLCESPVVLGHSSL
jgi:hypothetical protein